MRSPLKTLPIYNFYLLYTKMSVPICVQGRRELSLDVELFDAARTRMESAQDRIHFAKARTPSDERSSRNTLAGPVHP